MRRPLQVGRKHEQQARQLDAEGNEEALAGCLTFISVSCLSRLLATHPHFNFASNIMNSLVRRLESPVDRIFDSAHSAISTLLEGQVHEACQWS